MSMRFHWRMIHRGETAGVPRGTQNLLIEMSQPDLVAQAEFCRRALASGIESLLLDFGFGKHVSEFDGWVVAELASRREDQRFLQDLFHASELPLPRTIFS